MLISLKLRHPFPEQIEPVCGISVPKPYSRDPSIIVEPVGNLRFVFPIGYCGHAVLDYVWFVGQFEQHSLHVREVIELEEQVAWPVSNSLQVRECAEEGENFWKEPCSCHKAQRIPI
jgi:hypothetical protein